ncbi:hypothetical protein HAX54_003014 [Datura stramonium]|uniref:Uncharacterized protein n=1 Tax=Datura stramonium TaxID=4076 RepID=A0ABS8WUF7_DATST|nr:hypothetical protein [Datura stramonium]
MVLDHGETPIIYFDEAFKSNEVDPSAYYFSIKIRCEKVLQSDLGITQEEESHDDEKLCLSVESTSREVIDEASRLDELDDFEEGDKRGVFAIIQEHDDLNIDVKAKQEAVNPF